MRCDWCGTIMTPRLLYDGERGVGLSIPVVRCHLTIGNKVRDIQMHPVCAQELSEVLASKANTEQEAARKETKP